MRFYVNADDNTAGRYADALSYVTDAGIDYSIVVTESRLSLDVRGRTGEVVGDIVDAALVVAQVAYAARNMSLGALVAY